MNPIIIIEDDIDDQQIIKDVFHDMELVYPLAFFTSAENAYIFLSNDAVRPFLVFTDINLPGMNGLMLRDKIHEDKALRLKCIPFIFMTTASDHKTILDAYSEEAQGYFVKPTSMEDWKELLGLTIAYWNHARRPS